MIFAIQPKRPKRDDKSDAQVRVFVAHMMFWSSDDSKWSNGSFVGEREKTASCPGDASRNRDGFRSQCVKRLIDNAKNVQCDDDVSVTQHHLTSCLRHSIIEEVGRALGDAT